MTYFFMSRAKEIFAFTNGSLHRESCVTRGDVAFLLKNVPWYDNILWPFTDGVQLRSEDKKHLGAVVHALQSCVFSGQHASYDGVCDNFDAPVGGF